MFLSSLKLTQFRSYSEREFKFDPGVTIITGPNGIGKTNILEAIYVLSTGKSFRDPDEALAQYESEWWRVQGVIDDAPREVRWQRGDKEYIYDEQKYSRFPSKQRLPVVLFEPDDLMLVHGSPQKRRAYLDNLISQTVPGYASSLRRFERALAQRNRLLKNSSFDADSLFVWDIMLAEEAAHIITERRTVIGELNQQLAAHYSTIADKESSITITYHSPITAEHYKQSLLNHLKSRQEHDRVTGFTSVGPHRDDIEFFLDGKSTITTASRGEVRSLLLALKSYESDRLEAHHGAKPLLLLDDVFSELDSKRQQRLIRSLDGEQAIISSTKPISGSNNLAISQTS